MTLQPLVEPVKHDDVTLRPDERLRLGSIVAGWDGEVECNHRAGCAVGAEWRYRCPSCPHEWLYCDQHKRSDVEEDLRDLASPWGATTRCADCRSPLPMPMPWRPL